MLNYFGGGYLVLTLSLIQENREYEKSLTVSFGNIDF